jgi:hypothetical protein
LKVHLLFRKYNWFFFEKRQWYFGFDLSLQVRHSIQLRLQFEVLKHINQNPRFVYFTKNYFLFFARFFLVLLTVPMTAENKMANKNRGTKVQNNW